MIGSRKKEEQSKKKKAKEKAGSETAGLPQGVPAVSFYFF